MAGISTRLFKARTLGDLRMELLNWPEGVTVGFVPTMGALHAGHLSLINFARERCDKVVVSIFVNPLQFGVNEDLDRYPRQEEEDLAKLRSAAVDVAYLPYLTEIYPDEFKTKITVAGITEVLCGASRPGHFDGVATVVAKLLLQVNPSVAFFGEKDYQQLMVVRRVVEDLNIAVDIVGVPTIREMDGLAMSSRNQYLTPAQRIIAPQLYHTLRQMKDRLIAQEEGETVLQWGKERLAEVGFDKIDYLELRDSEHLSVLNRPLIPARLFAAAWLGGTRLIDNVKVR